MGCSAGSHRSAGAYQYRPVDEEEYKAVAALDDPYSIIISSPSPSSAHTQPSVLSDSEPEKRYSVHSSDSGHKATHAGRRRLRQSGTIQSLRSGESRGSDPYHIVISSPSPSSAHTQSSVLHHVLQDSELSRGSGRSSPSPYSSGSDSCQKARHSPGRRTLNKGLSMESFRSDLSRASESTRGSELSRSRGSDSSQLSESTRSGDHSSDKSSDDSDDGGTDHEDGQATSLESCFIMESVEDREGGNRKSFHEKAFDRHGEIVNPADQGIYVTCRKGMKSRKAPNQDSWCILKAEAYAIYGVFDGHGPKGHIVSNYVKTELPKLIENDVRLLTKWTPQLLLDAFAEMTQKIEMANQDGTIDSSKSGTTATVIVHDFDKELLTIAYVGDSGAALARGTEKVMEYVTPNHNPSVDQEKWRIRMSNGRVIKNRVYTQEGPGPGLNMTRAFGDDEGRSVGVISIPDVIEIPLSKTDPFLLVCSDGVWEFMPEDDVGDVINRALADKKNPAEELAVESLRRWRKFVKQVDDITGIVVDLQKFHGEDRICSEEDDDDIDMKVVDSEQTLPKILRSPSYLPGVGVAC